MRRIKRIAALLLSIAMCLSLLSVCVCAALSPEIEKSFLSAQNSNDVLPNTDNAVTADTQTVPQQEDCPNSWRYKEGEIISSSDPQLSTQDMVPSDAVSCGIDVSHHQGSIDWATVKNNIDFAIIRCGFGDDYTYQDDSKYLENALACEKYGIPYGVYIYSYATNAQMAQSEANHVLRLVKGRTMSLPIYYDLEDDSISQSCTKEQILSNTKVFCNMIESAGYSVGIYANQNWWLNYLTSNEYDKWQRWYAQYNSRAYYSKDFVIWQYSAHGSVPGISGDVDMNYSRVSYTKDSTPTISGANSPGTLAVGSVFSIKGTVSCGQSLTNVTAGVYDADGNMKTGKSASPNSTSYNIVGLDNEVYFNHLSPGVYRYKVSATASGKTTVLLTKDFIVLAKSDTVSPGTYMIESCGNSGLVAGAGDDSNVLLQNKSGLDSQLFEVSSIGNGYYHLKNIETGKLLDVYGAASAPETNVQLYSQNDSSAQNWQILHVMDGYALVPQCGTSNCLDVYGAVFNSGSNIQVYTAHLNNLAQRFKLIPATSIKTNLSTCTIALSGTSFVYDGTAKQPEITVKEGNKTLTKDTDYDVSYTNNVEVGTATVTITGKGKYFGSVEQTFTITIKEDSSTTDATAVFAVGSTRGNPGKQIKVPVSITKNPGIAGFALDIEYDHSLLTLKDAAAVSSLGGTFTRSSDCVTWFGDDNIRMTGKAFELTFDISTNAGEKQTDVKLSMHNGKPNVTDEDFANVPALFEKGTVTIRFGVRGDVTGDGDVTIADVVKVNRHVSGKTNLTDEEKLAADVTDDGDVTIADVVKMNRFVAGKISFLDVPISNNK